MAPSVPSPGIGPPMLDPFLPLVEAACGLDLSRPREAELELRRRWDPAAPAAREAIARWISLLEEGRIAHRGEPPVRYSRIARPGPQTGGYSVDVVHMEGAGPHHRHPKGEIDLAVALEGNPTFDGRPPGWIVLPPDSSHTPTVEGGAMLVVYLLPDGQIDFDT